MSHSVSSLDTYLFKVFIPYPNPKSKFITSRRTKVVTNTAITNHCYCPCSNTCRRFLYLQRQYRKHKTVSINTVIPRVRDRISHRTSSSCSSVGSEPSRSQVYVKFSSLAKIWSNDFAPYQQTLDVSSSVISTKCFQLQWLATALNAWANPIYDPPIRTIVSSSQLP